MHAFAVSRDIAYYYVQWFFVVEDRPIQRGGLQAISLLLFIELPF